MGKGNDGENVIDKKYFLEYVFAGGCSAMISSTLTHPFDLLEVRMQSSKDLKALSKVKSASIFTKTFRGIREVLRYEGFFGLGRGLLPSLMGSIPGKAILFGVYEYSKDMLIKKNICKKDSALLELGASTIAGCVSNIILNPLFFLKTRIQIQEKLLSDSNTAINVAREDIFDGYIDCIKKTYQKEGITAFWRGLSASLLGISEQALFFIFYEKVKRYYRINQRILDNDFPIIKLMMISSTCKMIVNSVTYPYETIRTRVREISPDGTRKYNGIIPTCKIIAKEEGWIGFYGGLDAHLIRSIPSTIIFFLCYEYIKNNFFNKEEII